MKTAPRVNYVGPSEIEYTEIRPIRPNQSVILAGLQGGMLMRDIYISM